MQVSDRQSNVACGINHLAVIMDGNGRWAKKRHLPRTMGHRKGAERLHDLCSMCADRGIKYLTCYAFSTENWKRQHDEVNAIMRLLVEFLHSYFVEMAKEGVRIRFAGDIDGLPENVRREIRYAEEISRDRTRINLIMAFNYGGRREIISAVKHMHEAILRDEFAISELNETSFRKFLYLSDVPDPDLVIRPSGELRLSNFLLWQSAYAELYFSNVLWPDFSEKELDEAIASFKKRDRRYGAVSKEEQ